METCIGYQSELPQKSSETENEQQVDLLIALLSNLQFEGFHHSGNCLDAYIPRGKDDKQGVVETLQQLELPANVQFSREENFEPVVIAGKVGSGTPSPNNFQY